MTKITDWLDLSRPDGATLRRRLLFLLGGIVVGLLAVGMALLADRAQLCCLPPPLETAGGCRC